MVSVDAARIAALRERGDSRQRLPETGLSKGTAQRASSSLSKNLLNGKLERANWGFQNSMN